ncbi:hypothetical protein [Streptomyces sp. MspMP-M5]|uniref:hypothetical protein n=1 Tax=Streptomyces sp. MspMP-M5 TaxID=1155718 RepID=UPI003B6342C9
MLGGAGLLLATGAGAVFAARRRRTDDGPTEDTRSRRLNAVREVPFSHLRLRDFDETDGPAPTGPSVTPYGALIRRLCFRNDGRRQVAYESRLLLVRPLLADFDPSVCGIYVWCVRISRGRYRRRSTPCPAR